MIHLYDIIKLSHILRKPKIILFSQSSRFVLEIIFTLLVLVTGLIILPASYDYATHADNHVQTGDDITQDNEGQQKPQIVNIGDDEQFEVQTIYAGIESPTNMAFLGPNDILVLEKNKGIVNRIVNGIKLEEPLLDVNVVYSDGLTGIALSKDIDERTHVFLYYTKAPDGYNEDVDSKEEIQLVDRTFGFIRECNCVYRYELVNNKLINPKLLLDLPVEPGIQHHGGEIAIGPDNNVYVVIGNLEGQTEDATKTQAQNFEEGPEPDGRAGIIRVTQDGKVVDGKGIIGEGYPLNMYYAYGIRNGFGMDFDPVTGNLWDTENGPSYGDEINLVEPGFNSGSEDVYGIPATHDKLSPHKKFDPDKLASFDGRGKYSDPEFTWNVSVAPTAIKFLNSDKYGEEYENDIFVSDVLFGNIYRFDLNEDRTELILDGRLRDKIADDEDQLQDIIFGTGFSGITDLQIGPDGYLYGLDGDGVIFRIVPAN